MTAPRTILYTGKGGVGKTSVAAATARLCAARGLRTVVLSTDPAHSLSDSLEADLGADPTPIGERLWGQEVQAQREMEDNWGQVQHWLAGLLADRGVMDIAAEELTVPPGMDELFSLLQIKRHHASGDYDVVIVDCAPTGETLRLLSFPEIAQWWLEKVFGRDRIDIKAGHWAVFIGSAQVPPGAGKIVSVGWDFTGSGSYSPAQFGRPVFPAQLALHRFTTPGTYYVTLKVASSRTGTAGSFAQVENLDRVRIVVH